MRVAVVTTSWPRVPGDPAGHFVRAEARALERAGNEVVVLAPLPGGAFGWPGVAERVRERPFRAIEAAWWVAASRRRVARMNADRVVSHWAVPCAWPIGVGANDAALDVTSHGGDVRLLVALPVAARRLIVSAIGSRAKRWRFVSASLMRALLGELDRETRVCVERIAIVEPAAIEMPDVSAEIRSRRNALGGLRIAVSVGRLVQSKGVDRAIAHVARSPTLDALVVIGDGPDRSRLEHLARRLNVDARFVGALTRPDALVWIGAADVLIHASRAEGASTVIREAEALGTHVEVL
jgi:teichuronic acid biosynthesis glycosyltransferase TuaC